MTSPSDQKLIEDLHNGSLPALGELYDRFRPLVFRTALAITGDQEAASDLLQDVFLRLYRFSDRIDPQRPIEPWLYRMTVNLSYTWIKRSRKWLRPLEDLAEWLTGSVKNQPYEVIERLDDWEQVQKAVAFLPLQQRVVIVMYYLNDLSLQEIAEVIDVPVGTVKSRLHYGRQTLKKSLELGHFSAAEQLPDLNI